MSRWAEQVTIARLPGEEVLVTVGEREFVIAAACPHRKGRLLYAYVNAKTMRITCPLHRSTYDLVTGCQVSGPAASGLAVRERTDGSSC
jgi:nitrite reductase/ring-hydroxylating ferredoxin subunit